MIDRRSYSTVGHGPGEQNSQTDRPIAFGHVHDDLMWTSFNSWLMLALGCALSLAQGGRRAGKRGRQVITRSDLRYATKLRENWPEAVTETVALFLVVAGAAFATRYSLWVVPVAFVGLVLLPMIPVLIHNTRVTGRPVLPGTAPVDTG